MILFIFTQKIQNMKKQNNKAFTLVELIVVIAILAVLATVAFISFQGYTSSSRDSVRLADLKNISKSFEINRTKDIDFPLPDKKVDISASGTVFQYQWELSQNILESDLNIFDGGLDPVTLKPYGYAVNLARNKFQIIWFLENSQTAGNNLFSQSLADNTDKYVKSSGDALWILLTEDTNEVIVQSGSLNEIDIENNDQNYSFIVNTSIETWNNYFLQNEFTLLRNQKASCKAILYSWNEKGNGIYSINPSWIDWEEFEVYCDMTNNWWWWTLLMNASWNKDFDKSTFWSNFTDYNWTGVSKSYSQLPLWNNILLEFSNFKIEDWNDLIRKDIFKNVDFKWLTIYEMVNGNNESHVFFSGFTEYINISNNHLFPNDYWETWINTKKLAFNDSGYILWLDSYNNSAGWPNYNDYLPNIYPSHWWAYLRLWTK